MGRYERINSKNINQLPYYNNDVEIMISPTIPEWMTTKNMREFIKNHLITESEFLNLPTFDAYSDTIISLFTENGRKIEEIHFSNKSDLIRSNFNKMHDTRILIPGSKVESIQMKIVQVEYSKHNLNVFLIQWRNESQGMSAVGAGPLQNVSDQILILIENILKIFKVTHSSIYIVGHGIGAHVAGFVGKLVEYTTRNKLGTIFAIDPVEDDFPYQILNKTNAKYVEIFQTTKKPFSIFTSVGHVNFYSNENFQSICFRNEIDSDYWKCAHNLALIYFAASINSKIEFPSIKCELNDCFSNRIIQEYAGAVKMGGEPSNMGKDIKGIFWLNTKNKLPLMKNIK